MNTSTIEKRGLDWLMHQKYCKAAFNNMFVFPWECDVFGITKSKMTHEVEVKISKGDFVADFRNKKEKHYRTSNGVGANYFWYAVPYEMKTYALERIPEYAGLLVANDKGFYPITISVKAPELHRRKLEDDIPEFWEKLAMKLFYKHTKFGV